MELDDAALATILPLLRRLAARYRFIDPSIDADDLAQEAVLRLLEGTRRGTCAFLADREDATRYLVRTLSSVAIDRARRAKFRAPYPVQDGQRGDHDTEAAALDACAVDEALALVGDDPSGDLALLRGVGYGLDEAAVILRIPYTTARMRCIRLHLRMADGRAYHPNPGRPPTLPLTTIKRMP